MSITGFDNTTSLYGCNQAIVGGIITASLGASTDEAVNALSFTGQLISSLALDTVSVGVETSLDLAFLELFPGEQI